MPCPEVGPCPLLALLHPWASLMGLKCPHQPQALLTGGWLEPSLLNDGASCLPLHLGDVVLVPTGMC